MSANPDDHRDDAFFVTSGGSFDINTTHEVRSKLDHHDKPLVQTPNMSNAYFNQVKAEIEAGRNQD